MSDLLQTIADQINSQHGYTAEFEEARTHAPPVIKVCWVRGIWPIYICDGKECNDQLIWTRHSHLAKLSRHPTPIEVKINLLDPSIDVLVKSMLAIKEFERRMFFEAAHDRAI